MLTIVGAFSMIVKTDCETDGSFYSTTLCGGGGRGRDQRRQELLGLHAAGEGLLAAVAVAVPVPGVARAAQDAHHAADIVD